jgi:regulator of replication initiation timing
MPRNRQKPGSSRTFAAGGERPISINGEKQLDKAVADNTLSKEKITVLEEENAKLQLELEEAQSELNAAEQAIEKAEKAKEKAMKAKRKAEKDAQAAIDAAAELNDNDE